MQKIRAAVCDDEKEFLCMMEEMLRKTGKVEEVWKFQRVEELLEYCRKETGPEVVFLDIDFEGKAEGMIGASRLYECSPKTQVVYVTGYTDKFVQDVFLKEANLCGFLKKPVEEKWLLTYLEKVQEQLNKWEKEQLVLQMKGSTEVIDIGELLYLESDGHKIYLHTASEFRTIYGKLEEVKAQLPEERFVHCHKSFLVNMAQIARMESDQIILKDGQKVMVSKRRCKETREKFFRYLRECL